MKLTGKLVLALVLLIVAIQGVASVVNVRSEVAVLEDGDREDAAVLGRVLARVVADAYRTGGEDAVREILADRSLHGSALGVQLVRLDDGPAPDVDAGLVAEARAGRVASRRTGDVMVTLAPASVDGGHVLGVVLTESMRREQRHVRGVIALSVVSGVLLLLAVTGSSMVIGYRLVGRPVSQLVSHSRRIANGELGAHLELRQHDEIGWLATEMNAMSTRLLETRDHAAQAQRAEVAAIEQLRHADRLATVGQLASGVAHELGTPLNVVTGRAQMIASGELVGAEIADSATIIHEQGQRMARIVRQLLDFARTRSVSAAAVSLRVLAERTRVLVDAMARTRGVALELRPGDEVAASVDEGLIQQSLLNLIVNAIQATPAGGHVSIAIDTIDRAPPATSSAQGLRWARIRVIDDGAGMDPATRRRIFEPFFTTKAIGVGTGLGLSVTFGILRDCGGWIDVDSEPGHGSTFSLFMPPAEPAA